MNITDITNILASDGYYRSADIALRSFPDQTESRMQTYITKEKKPSVYLHHHPSGEVFLTVDGDTRRVNIASLTPDEVRSLISG